MMVAGGSPDSSRTTSRAIPRPDLTCPSRRRAFWPIVQRAGGEQTEGVSARSRRLSPHEVPWACVLSSVMAAPGCTEKEDAHSVAPATAECKRGVAWPGERLSDSEIAPALAWWYNWGPSASGDESGPEFVPMAWGAGTTADELSSRLADGAQFLLGFNEPNFHAQANLSA